jgi:M6 family metalloprotease-like protein
MSHNLNAFRPLALRSAVAIALLATLVCQTIKLKAQVGHPAAIENPGAAQVRTLNNSLLQLHSRMQQELPDAAQTRAEAATVISQRASALNALIQANPQAALSFAFSSELLSDLAAKFPGSAGLLESHATITGKVERWTADYPGLKNQVTSFRFKGAGQALSLYFAGQSPLNLRPTDTTQVTGVIVGYAMAVSSTVVAPSSTSLSSIVPSCCSTTGVQSTVALLVNLPGGALPSQVTVPSLNEILFGTAGPSLDGFLREASYGQASAAGNTFGPYNLTGTYTSCTDVGAGILNDTITAAVASGVNLQSYNRVFIVFPDIFNCGWAGYTSNANSITSTSGTFNASVAYLSARYVVTNVQGVELATHELGHDLGLLHSGTITATAGVLGPITAPGTENDLGDNWSTMGGMSLGQYPAPQKAEVLGWLAPMVNYQTVESGGTYTLQPLEIAPPGLQALKVQRGTGNNEWLWIEYRQPLGNYDTTLFAQPFSGALIHYEDSGTSLGHSYLPNFTPSDTTGLNPALAQGQTWVDPYSNVSISVLSATPSGLTVSVNYGAAPCTHVNPTITITPLDPSLYPGSSANYAISVTNNDPAACTTSTFSLNSSEPTAWPTSFSNSAITLNPGQSVSLTMSKIGPMGTPPGTYAVNALVANGALQTSGTANATVTAAPPPVTVTLLASAPSYTRRSTAAFTATVLSGSSPVPGASVSFSLTKANGSTLSKTLTTNSSGSATWSYKLSQKDPAGTWYEVSQTTYSSTGAANTQPVMSNTVSFTVQ